MHGAVGEASLVVDRLTVRYGPFEALAGVGFSIEPGELVALVGPNGAGKSTLFRAVVGLIPYSGSIAVHQARRSSVAYVAQRLEAELDFPLTVSELVATGRRALRRTPWPAAGDAPAVGRCLGLVGLSGFEARSLGSLSAGQLQRALIARALAQEPSALLLDETLAGVDEEATEAILDLLDRLTREGAAIVVATHDLDLVRRRFLRCIAVNRTLVGDGAPSTVLGPESLLRFFDQRPAVAV